MKTVYICSPCRGDYKANIESAKEYSRAALMLGFLPVTPHIYFTQFMDDAIESERILAMDICRELVSRCDELWAFGINDPSTGMQEEIETAQQKGIPVYDGFVLINNGMAYASDLEG